MSKLHSYDSISYMILLGFKLLIGVIFAMGSIKSHISSPNVKTQKFIK